MARRDIKAGEQLFYNYCDVLTTAAERKISLARYGITNCTCASCTNATPETDALRRTFGARVREYFYRTAVWHSNGDSPNESMLDEMFEFQKAVIKEGLHTRPDYWEYFMVALIVACDLAKMKTELENNMMQMLKHKNYCMTNEALTDSK
jgi:hypothetical protein